jgi:hypothetical protein
MLKQKCQGVGLGAGVFESRSVVCSSVVWAFVLRADNVLIWGVSKLAIGTMTIKIEWAVCRFCAPQHTALYSLQALPWVAEVLTPNSLGYLP